MSRFNLCGFTDYEDGKMGRFETAGPIGMPVNIFIDNAADFTGEERGLCSVDVSGVGRDIQVYESEETYLATDPKTDVPSLIPMGTFSPSDDGESFDQSPDTSFTGRVLDVDWDREAGEDEPNCCMLIETLELTFSLYLRYDRAVKKGYVVHGTAWLFGDLVITGE